MMRKVLFLSLTAVALVGFTGVARAADGAELYKKKCATCHGEDGKGKTKMGEKLKVKDLTDAAAWKDLTEEKVSKGIADGIEDKKMPGMKDKWSADEIKAVTQHTMTLKPK